MVGGEHLGLGGEEALRVAHVLFQVGRHVRLRFEHAGEDLFVGADDRVGGVEDVKAHVAVVGVKNDLHRVADVIDGAVRLGVGVTVGGGIGVGDPIELATDDHHVGVRVKAEEGCRRGQAGLDVAIDEHAASGGDGR